MFCEALKVLVACSCMFVSIPRNPDLPPLPRPDLKIPVPELFPLDDKREITIDLKVIDRESKLTMTFLVEEKEDKKYLYTYTVTNDGEYPVAIRYSILDQVSGAEVMLLYLEPTKSRTITVESEKMPVYAEGIAQVWLMVKPDDEQWKEDIKKAGATVSGNFFHPVTGKVKGPIPMDTK